VISSATSADTNASAPIAGTAMRLALTSLSGVVVGGLELAVSSGGAVVGGGGGCVSAGSVVATRGGSVLDATASGAAGGIDDGTVEVVATVVCVVVVFCERG
jgi:hypothetical protein